MRDNALAYLRKALDDPHADFRDGQWRSIAALLDRQRLFVVQRTGWGKSMVYFLATRLLRDEGAGFTLLISPLLSLMRNQKDAAARIGIRAESLDSTNDEQWDDVEHALLNDDVDILLVSPERLANERFQKNVLERVAHRIGLFVVDEAHCISDWGHDFRPDYRRIRRVLPLLPSNVAVLATTATANDRVVTDVVEQLGDDVQLIRGTLRRDSLQLQNIALPSPSARLAWLAEQIPRLPGSGIVYTLTVRDAEQVAAWLREHDIAAEAYFAGRKDSADGPSLRERLEQQLLNNEIKVLVATVALGMGFDKPDLGFVIHYQRPASVVHYYQQVGRAGRAVDEAYGILLHGEEDDSIADFFIRSAFPPTSIVEAILDVLDSAEAGLSIHELQQKLDMRQGDLDRALKYLTMETPAPVTKVDRKWTATAAVRAYHIDHDQIEQITALRRSEQDEMRRYMTHQGCLMEFLGRALDDAETSPCGRCAGCLGESILPVACNSDLVADATHFAKRSRRPLAPRKIWPKDALLEYDFAGRLGPELVAAEGRALCLWRDAGWGELVARGRCETGRFGEELVTACAEMLDVWMPEPAPTWVACIPSSRHPVLVPDFAARLAAALKLPFVACVEIAREHREQKYMSNSFHQAQNLDGAFRVNPDGLPDGPCLLVDDTIDSKWTMTVASALLRQAGCPVVFPLALALNSPRRD